VRKGKGKGGLKEGRKEQRGSVRGGPDLFFFCCRTNNLGELAKTGKRKQRKVSEKAKTCKRGEEAKKTRIRRGRR